MRGFVVLPKRWIVERFFAHLMRSRRLVRDFERSTERPGAGSASHPRAVSRFAFDRNASIYAGTGSRPKQPAISWHVSGP